MTRPEFPNSAFVRAPERFVLRGGRWQRIDLAVRYGRFTHPVAGHCLIDTGYTHRVTRGRRSLPLRLYNAILRPKLTDAALGPDIASVDTVLLTHLHADHISGLQDCPNARIYLHGGAYDHFVRVGWLGRTRHGVFGELIPDRLSDRIVRIESLSQIEGPPGLGPCHDLFGDGSVLAAPLPGHMKGHFGFVWPRETPPLLYAADAQWLSRAILERRSPGPPARWVMEDPAAADRTAERISAFVAAGGEIVLCHDPEEAK